MYLLYTSQACQVCSKNSRMEEEKHLATDETNQNMEKDKIIDNGNVISLYKCHFNCSGELL